MIKNVQHYIGGCLAFPLLAALVGGGWLQMLHVLVPVTKGLPAPWGGLLIFAAAMVLVGFVVLLMTLWFTRGVSTRPLLGGEAGKSRKTTKE
jgi:hypothetical protein